MRVIHVAVAVVRDAAGRVLLGRRAEHVHQGGLWEFPGGKVEHGEDVQQALARELNEEVGIRPRMARPLIRVPHDYGDRHVVLDVWQVDAFSGQPVGREGQPLQWVAPAELWQLDLPAANRPIIRALNLPDHYLITPEPGVEDQWLAALSAAAAGGVRMVQLRLADPEQRQGLLRQAVELLQAKGVTVLVNAEPALALALAADGVHLNSRRLHQLAGRPVGVDLLLGASCHDPQELALATRSGVDFALLSPVKPTRSHPDKAPLGWSRFARWVDAVPLPVYALGGLGRDDIDAAHRHGAQGIAAVRGLWPQK